jgi:hypothetical protein
VTSYKYDAADNLVEEKRGSTTKTYGYDAEDRLWDLTVGAAGEDVGTELHARCGYVFKMINDERAHTVLSAGWAEYRLTDGSFTYRCGDPWVKANTSRPPSRPTKIETKESDSTLIERFEYGSDKASKSRSAKLVDAGTTKGNKGAALAKERFPCLVFLDRPPRTLHPCSLLSIRRTGSQGA